MSNQLGFCIEQDQCIGCFTCQIACKDKNNLDLGQNFRRVREFAGGGYTKTGEAYQQNVYAYWISLSCNHCENPKCLENCPTGAISKRAEDGVVLINRDRCIGCGYCTWSCPYGAPQLNTKTGKMGKCDFCQDLLAKGEEPVCVTACPMRVLHFGKLEDLKKQYGGTATIKGLPEETITHPSLVIVPHKNAAP